MNPIVGYDLFCDPELTTFTYLPCTHPESFHYTRSPSGEWACLQEFTSSFYRWLLTQVAALKLSAAGQAQLAQNHVTLVAVRRYAELRWTAATIASAIPSIIIPAVPAALYAILEEFAPLCPELWLYTCPSCLSYSWTDAVQPSRCFQCRRKWPKWDEDGDYHPFAPERISWHVEGNPAIIAYSVRIGEIANPI